MIIENQKVCYRFEDDKPGLWREFSAEQCDLRKWCSNFMLENSWQSNGCYELCVEFDIDGKRWFAVGDFGAYDYDERDGGTHYSGRLNYWDLMSYEQLKDSSFSSRDTVPHRYSPSRDYIHVSSWNFRSTQ